MIITLEYDDCKVFADAIARRIKEERKFSSDINDKDALWVELEDILFPVSYELFDANDIEVKEIGCGRGVIDYNNKWIEDMVIEKLKK